MRYHAPQQALLFRMTLSATVVVTFLQSVVMVQAQAPLVGSPVIYQKSAYLKSRVVIRPAYECPQYPSYDALDTNAYELLVSFLRDRLENSGRFVVYAECDPFHSCAYLVAIGLYSHLDLDSCECHYCDLSVKCCPVDMRVVNESKTLGLGSGALEFSWTSTTTQCSLATEFEIETLGVRRYVLKDIVTAHSDTLSSRHRTIPSYTELHDHHRQESIRQAVDRTARWIEAILVDRAHISPWLRRLIVIRGERAAELRSALELPGGEVLATDVGEDVGIIPGLVLSVARIVNNPGDPSTPRFSQVGCDSIGVVQVAKVQGDFSILAALDGEDFRTGDLLMLSPADTVSLGSGYQSESHR